MKLAHTLLNIISTINSQLDSEQALCTILEQLAHLVEFDSASIMLLEGEVLNSVARHSIYTPKSNTFSIPVAKLAHIEKVIAQKRAVLICDTQSDSGWLVRQGNESIRCWLGVPLTVRGSIIGMLNLSSATADVFDSHDVAVVTAFATHVAAVILNVRLFAELQQELRERKRVEEELRCAKMQLEQRVAERTAELQLVNAKLAAALQIKDTVISNVSHEFRNPLNVILLLTDSAEKGMQGSLNEKFIKMITKVRRNAQKLSSLVNDMLDLSKLGSGTFEVCLRTVSVQDICNKSITLVQSYADSRQICLVQKLQGVDRQVDRQVQADEGVLVQVLVKLLENAIKFSSEKSQVTVEVVSHAADPMVHFRVSDMGIGIAADEIANIFCPFAQVDSKTTRKFDGAGLGLALVRHLVELNHGTISVESTVGCGSCFTVSIPAVQP